MNNRPTTSNQDHIVPQGGAPQTREIEDYWGAIDDLVSETSPTPNPDKKDASGNNPIFNFESGPRNIFSEPLSFFKQISQDPSATNITNIRPSINFLRQLSEERGQDPTKPISTLNFFRQLSQEKGWDDKQVGMMSSFMDAVLSAHQAPDQSYDPSLYSINTPATTQTTTTTTPPIKVEEQSPAPYEPPTDNLNLLAALLSQQAQAQTPPRHDSPAPNAAQQTHYSGSPAPPQFASSETVTSSNVASAIASTQQYAHLVDTNNNGSNNGSVRDEDEEDEEMDEKYDDKYDSYYKNYNGGAGESSTTATGVTIDYNQIDGSHLDPEKPSPLMADDELINLSVRDLNRKLMSLTKPERNVLKRRRRLLKNRGYAQICRSRRISQQKTLSEENKQLRQLLSQVVVERNTYKNKYEQLKAAIKKAKRESTKPVAAVTTPVMDYTQHHQQ